jgi:hypothetical protein
MCSIVIVTACSSRASSLDEASLVPVFDAIGDRVAADIQAAARRPIRSKLAAIEPVAWATPAGFPRYAHMLDEHHVDFAAIAAFAQAHPEAFERLGARIEQRAAPAIAALQHAVADLPATDPADCAALSERVPRARQSVAESSLATVLSASLAACVN